jgi:hypothetical protein
MRIIGKLLADGSRKKAYMPKTWRNHIIIIIIWIFLSVRYKVPQFGLSHICVRFTH